MNEQEYWRNRYEWWRCNSAIHRCSSLLIQQSWNDRMQQLLNAVDSTVLFMHVNSPDRPVQGLWLQQASWLLWYFCTCTLRELLYSPLACTSLTSFYKRLPCIATICFCSPRQAMSNQFAFLSLLSPLSTTTVSCSKTYRLSLFLEHQRNFLTQKKSLRYDIMIRSKWKTGLKVATPTHVFFLIYTTTTPLSSNLLYQSLCFFPVI